MRCDRLSFTDHPGQPVGRAHSSSDSPAHRDSIERHVDSMVPIESSVLVAKAEALGLAHHGPEPLVVPNAWDVASARSVEAAGFLVIATTSGGVANALG